MIVYHGSVQIIEKPDVLHSYRPLDFGRGFYVTTNREQAVKWAKRKNAVLSAEKAVINIYRMNDPGDGIKEKQFEDDLSEWLDFVCSCRDGGEEYLKFDLITGKVADDKVFRVVDMYHAGVWDKGRALKEIRVYQTYDQIAFITQKAIDKLLRFETAEEV